MDLRRKSTFFLLFLIFICLSACASSATTATPVETTAEDQTLATVEQENTSVIVEESSSPGEVIHISGEGSYISDAFTLEGPGEIELFWKQDCQVFYLQLINANESLAQAPGGTVIFESAASPSENTASDELDMSYPYLPGEYVVRIDAEGGAWEVWAIVTPSELQ